MSSESAAAEQVRTQIANIQADNNRLQRELRELEAQLVLQQSAQDRYSSAVQDGEQLEEKITTASTSVTRISDEAQQTERSLQSVKEIFDHGISSLDAQSTQIGDAVANLGPGRFARQKLLLQQASRIVDSVRDSLGLQGLLQSEQAQYLEIPVEQSSEQSNREDAGLGEPMPAFESPRSM